MPVRQWTLALPILLAAACTAPAPEPDDGADDAFLGGDKADDPTTVRKLARVVEILSADGAFKMPPAAAERGASQFKVKSVSLVKGKSLGGLIEAEASFFRRKFGVRGSSIGRVIGEMPAGGGAHFTLAAGLWMAHPSDLLTTSLASPEHLEEVTTILKQLAADVCQLEAYYVEEELAGSIVYLILPRFARQGLRMEMWYAE